MSNTKRKKDFYYFFYIALTPAQKLPNFVWCYSISCLSLCLDQRSYLVIDDRDAISSGVFIHILIATFLANEKGNRLSLMYGVVAPCYQHTYKVPQLHTTEV